MKALLARALDLLYPPRCVSCGAFGPAVCEACVERLAPARGPDRCDRCGARREPPAPCRACEGWDALDGARAAFDMDGPARPVVHGLKYHGIRDLADPMAEALWPLVRELGVGTAVFAIPLHRSRRNQRGFNQSEVILKRLGARRAPGRLERIRATASQVGLGARARRENVAGAFRYRGPDLDGAAVAVLDDVVTTGATAQECARVLRANGAGRVHAVAYARATHVPGQPLD